MQLWSFDTSQPSNHVVQSSTTGPSHRLAIGDQIVKHQPPEIGSAAQRVRQPNPRRPRNEDRIRGFVVGQAQLPSVSSQPPAAMGNEKQLVVRHAARRPTALVWCPAHSIGSRRKLSWTSCSLSELHGGARCLARHGSDLQGPSCVAGSAPFVMKLPLRAVRPSACLPSTPHSCILQPPTGLFHPWD